MTMLEHIEYWIKSSNDDFEVFKVLLKSKHFMHSLFIAHLSLEKLIKAHWVKNNNNLIPPKTHNLTNLVKQTTIEFTNEQMVFLTLMNNFQIQGRYPDYKFKINQLLTEEYVNSIVQNYYEIRQCLQEKIV